MKLGHMIHVEPWFVLYALRVDPSYCLRAHIVLRRAVEPVIKRKETACFSPYLYTFYPI